MTVTVKNARKRISGVGWVNPLTHDFRLENSTYLKVYSDDDMSTPLVLGVDYTISGVGDVGGYTVTITTPGAWSPDWWVLSVETPIDQPVDISLGGAFGEKFENALDGVARRMQVLADGVLRALKLAKDTDPNVEFTIPSPESRKVVGWNVAGTDLQNWDNPTDSMEQAAASAAAALVSENNAAASEDAAAASAAAALTSEGNADASEAAALQAYNDTVAAIAALGNPMAFKGLWDASAGTFPGAGVARAGWTYQVSVAGTVGGQVFDVNDRLIAIVNNASTTVYAANWFRAETDLVQSVVGLQGAILAPDLRNALDTASYVATRTALKALDTTKDTVALLTETGRAGTFVWRAGNFSTQVTADTQEGVYVKADAIASSVGAWVRHDGGWAVLGVSPEMFGATGDGTTVDNTAVQAAATFAATYGVPLAIPGKSYRLTAAINVSAAITIRGAGMALSRLVWDSGDGFNVAATASKTTTIQDVSFETKAVAAGTALTIDYSALISGGSIMPRAETHAKLNRVRVRGATGYTIDGWLNGIVGVSLLGMDVDSCRLNGVYTGAYGSMPNSAKGIHFYGSGSPVQLTVSRTFISAWADAIYTADAEGIYLHNNELVTVGRGYQCVNAVAESGLVITDNHIAIIDTAVKIGNMADGSITGNVIYNVADATPLKGVHVQSGCKNLAIGGNVVRRLGAVSVLTAIHLEAGQDITVYANELDCGTSNPPILIDVGFTRATVMKQHYITAPSAAQITNNSATSMFEEFDGFTGDLDSVVLDSYRMTRQLYTLGSGVTNAPGAFTSTAGAVVETFSLDANTAYQRALSPNVRGASYLRRRASGAWGAWIEEASGGLPVTKTGDFTVGVGEDTLIVNKGSSCTVTLPSAATYPTRQIVIKTIQAFAVVSASSNVVPLTSAAAGTAILAATAGKWAKLKSDGSNWIIMQGN